MSTPPLLVELECPICHLTHWVIDEACREEGIPDEPFEKRPYTCRHCGHTAPGHRVGATSPPAFFLQPHRMYPMTQPEFDHWVGVLRANLPNNPWLAKLGTKWHP